MSYYDEEQYFEPSEADILLSEYQQKMKEVLISSVKNEIEAIKEENERLKVENEKLNKRFRNIELEEQQLEFKKKNLKFEDLDRYNTFFKTEEECQKYCDWLNEHIGDE